jgi:hypothetical protein
VSVLYDVIGIYKKTALFSGAVINVLGSLAAVFIFVFPGVHDVRYYILLFYVYLVLIN